MKTKGFFALAVFSIISLGAIAQGLNNESGYGFTGYRSNGFPDNYDPGRNPIHGNERIFNFAFVPSTGDDSLGKVPESVTNKMTCTDEITSEQVGLIFDAVKTFPEDTEISIAFINNDRVFFYRLKRQNNTIINIENHSSCEYTSAVVFDIKNETGIVILSNVPGLSKRKSKFYTLCFDLLATFSNDKH